MEQNGPNFNVGDKVFARIETCPLPWPAVVTAVSASEEGFAYTVEFYAKDLKLTLKSNSLDLYMESKDAYPRDFSIPYYKMAIKQIENACKEDKEEEARQLLAVSYSSSEDENPKSTKIPKTECQRSPSSESQQTLASSNVDTIPTTEASTGGFDILHVRTNSPSISSLTSEESSTSEDHFSVSQVAIRTSNRSPECQSSQSSED